MLESKTIIETENGNRLEFTNFTPDQIKSYGKIWREYDTNGNLIHERFSTGVMKNYLYDEDNKLIEEYDPMVKGAINEIRIFYDEGHKIKAELTFAFGGTTIIDWTDVTQRGLYEIGINAYTFIFDERDAVRERFFQDFIVTKETK